MTNGLPARHMFPVSTPQHKRQTTQISMFASDWSPGICIESLAPRSPRIGQQALVGLAVENPFCVKYASANLYHKSRCHVIDGILSSPSACMHMSRSAVAGPSIHPTFNPDPLTCFNAWPRPRPKHWTSLRPSPFAAQLMVPTPSNPTPYPADESDPLPQSKCCGALTLP